MKKQDIVNLSLTRELKYLMDNHTLSESRYVYELLACGQQFRASDKKRFRVCFANIYTERK